MAEKSKIEENISTTIKLATIRNVVALPLLYPSIKSFEIPIYSETLKASSRLAGKPVPIPDSVLSDIETVAKQNPDILVQVRCSFPKPDVVQVSLYVERKESSMKEAVPSKRSE